MGNACATAQLAGPSITREGRFFDAFSGVAIVLFFAISASAAEQRTTLDEAAQDYVHLVLEIGAHEKGYVDAYFGPSHWRVEAEAHPRVISELKVEADRIQSTLSAMDASAQQPAERRRNAWLKASVASARSRLDIIEGARFRFRDEATRLFAHA